MTTAIGLEMVGTAVRTPNRVPDHRCGRHAIVAVPALLADSVVNALTETARPPYQDRVGARDAGDEVTAAVDRAPSVILGQASGRTVGGTALFLPRRFFGPVETPWRRWGRRWPPEVVAKVLRALERDRGYVVWRSPSPEGIDVAYLDIAAAAQPAELRPGVTPPKAGDLAAYFHAGVTTGVPKRRHAQAVPEHVAPSRPQAS